MQSLSAAAAQQVLVNNPRHILLTLHSALDEQVAPGAFRHSPATFAISPPEHSVHTPVVRLHPVQEELPVATAQQVHPAVALPP